MCKIFTLTFLKDIFIPSIGILVAAGGVIIANKGLNTWKNQLHGQSNYELARRILVSLYKYREAIYGVRYPLIYSHEMEFSHEDENMGQKEKEYYGINKAYQIRWENIQNIKVILSADLFEAEALWGEEIRTLYNDILLSERTLLVAVTNYVEITSPFISEERKKAIENIVISQNKIRVSSIESEDDFNKEFMIKIEKIENYLRPKLSH